MDEKKSPSPLFVQRTMGISVFSNTQYLLRDLLDNRCAAQCYSEVIDENITAWLLCIHNDEAVCAISRNSECLLY